MKPLISIITPCLNSENFIEQTIDSVLSQEFNNIEFIIIDGGSTDGTLDIIRKYEKHIDYWISEPDNGQSEAINKGIERATGEVINWLNSDDYLEREALKTIAIAFKNPETKVLCGKSRKFEQSNKIISAGTEVYENNLSKTIGWARIDQPETWFRRSVFNEVGFLSESLHYLMDREWWIRYLLHFGLEGIVKTDQVLVNFRLHDGSKTVSQSEKFEIDHDTIFFGLAKASSTDEFGNTINEHFETVPDYKFPALDFRNVDLKSIISYYFLRKADMAYYKGNGSLARELIARVNPLLLDQNDKGLYKRLKIRSSEKIFPFVKRMKMWIHR